MLYVVYCSPVGDCVVNGSHKFMCLGRLDDRLVGGKVHSIGSKKLVVSVFGELPSRG